MVEWLNTFYDISHPFGINYWHSFKLFCETCQECYRDSWYFNFYRTIFLSVTYFATSRCFEIALTSKTLIQRRNNVVCYVTRWKEC